MKNSTLALLVASILFPAYAASANNELTNNDIILLGAENPFNVAAIEIAGDGNRLEILQEHSGGLGTNTISATINGDGNGGPLGSSFAGAPLQSGLRPGALLQSGFDNSISVSVTGSDNLFAFAQTGSGNRLSAAITGLANQAAVIQHGTNNHAGFSQNGTGNMISIMQRSF